MDRAARTVVERRELRSRLRRELERQHEERQLGGYFQAEFVWNVAERAARQWNREAWGEEYGPERLGAALKGLLGRQLGGVLDDPADEDERLAAECLYDAACEQQVKAAMLGGGEDGRPVVPYGRGYEGMDLGTLRHVTPSLVAEAEVEARVLLIGPPLVRKVRGRALYAPELTAMLGPAYAFTGPLFADRGHAYDADLGPDGLPTRRAAWATARASGFIADLINSYWEPVIGRLTSQRVTGLFHSLLNSDAEFQEQCRANADRAWAAAKSAGERKT